MLRTYSYIWTNTANFGAIADAQSHSGQSLTSPLPAVTYTPKGTAGSDTVSVEVFVVAADKTLHSLGTLKCQISVTVTTLIFTPSDSNVAVSQTQVFSVAPITGNFPSGSTYIWELSGQGSINGKQNLTTTVPQVTYQAPNHTAAGDLAVTVKNSSGKTIASGDLLITVETVTITPSSATFNGPGQATSFSVNGTFPSGTKFKWSCTSGGLSNGGIALPLPNTLTTTTPAVSYVVANPPADGSAATDTLTVAVTGPTGSSLGTTTATINYGGTPFFVATYPDKQVNKLVTGDVSSTDMENLIGEQTNAGLSYGIQDKQGFFQLLINVNSGVFLAPGQTYSPVWEQSPFTQLDAFFVGGYLAANSPQYKSGILKINSEIPSPAGNGMYIGYSFTIQCVGGGSIVANGVVLQHS